MKNPLHIALAFATLLILLSGPLVAADAPKADAKKPADEQHSDGGQWGVKPAAHNDPKLPRILLVGDSIAKGYHDEVARLLKGKVNVDLYITPKNLASKGVLDDLEAALKHGPYRVVHFNESGLHAWPVGAIPDGQYRPLMEKYIDALQKHGGGATLIWASNTPVTVKDKPGELDKEVNDRIEQFNRDARKAVENEHITVDDLYALMSDKLKLARGDRWHWTKPGSDLQAKAVAEAIEKAMNKPTEKPVNKK